MRLRGKPSKRWLLVGLCLASVVMVLVPASRRLGVLVRPVLVPLSQVGMAVPVTIRSRIDEITRPANGRNDDQIAALGHLVASQQEIIEAQRRQIDKLSQWRSRLKGFKCQLIEARIVGSEAVPLRDRRVIDAGSGGGLGPGDLVTTRRLLYEVDVALPAELAVLGQNYVVGRIIECAAFSATLQMVTDPAFEMPAMVWRLVGPGKQRTMYVEVPGGGRRKIVVGHDARKAGPQFVGQPVPVQAEGDGRQIVLRHVPDHHSICAGDILGSSGRTQLLPFGLRIGEVVRTEPERQDAHFVTVYVEPFANLAMLSDVFVVVPVGR